MLSAGGLAEIASAWSAADDDASPRELQRRLAAELSEPVSQRILRPYKGSRHVDLEVSRAYSGFWPDEAHTTTNVLCAIMQARASWQPVQMLFKLPCCMNTFIMCHQRFPKPSPLCPFYCTLH